MMSDLDTLKTVLLYHVVPHTLCSVGLMMSSVETASGFDVTIQVFRGFDGVQARVNDANIVATDLSVTNGVVHVVDQVLLPPLFLPQVLSPSD